jgi:urea transporter
MNEHPVLVSIVVAVAVAAATVWLATEAGVPTETAVPVIIVALLALRSAARRRTMKRALARAPRRSRDSEGDAHVPQS